MTTLHYLNVGDFQIQNQSLMLNIPGLTFVMFTSQRCIHCTKFAPEFRMLPNSMRGVNFAVCSVDAANNQIVQMASGTTTPFKGVPKFILYNDGVPFVEYNGQRTRPAVLQFLHEMIDKLNQKQSFTNKPMRSRQGGFNGQPQQPMQQQQQQQPQQRFRLNEKTQVKEYETSYGRPYNTTNETEFLEAEAAYKNVGNTYSR